MLKSRVFIVVSFLLATLCAAQAAMAQTVQDSTSVRSKVIYDPINYSQVRANLEWASKKTFWQRMVERFRAPLIKNNPDNKFQLTGSVGLGYMTETGVMFSAKAAAIYDKQIKGALDYPSTLSASAGVSVTGFYAINISGNNYFTDGKNRLSYSVDLSSLPIRFWGLGYEVQTNYRQYHADGDHRGELASPKQTQNRHKDNVHCGKECGFTCAGGNKAHLLQVHSQKQRQRTKESSDPKLLVGPFLAEGTSGFLIHYINEWQKADHCQTAADSLESKRPNIVHTHALCHEGRTPNDRCQQQVNTAAKLFFHNYHLGTF